MEHEQNSAEAVRKRGKLLYEQSIRAQVETEKNIVCVVVIDTEIGDYLVDEDADNPVIVLINHFSHRKPPDVKGTRKTISNHSLVPF